MSPYDLASETLFSLTSNKVRSVLTILGIVVGIAAVILMVAIGQGAQSSITKSIFVIEDCAPWPMATIRMTAAIPTTMPRMVSTERTLLLVSEKSVSLARS